VSVTRCLAGRSPAPTSSPEGERSLAGRLGRFSQLPHQRGGSSMHVARTHVGFLVDFTCT